MIMLLGLWFVVVAVVGGGGRNICGGSRVAAVRINVVELKEDG